MFYFNKYKNICNLVIIYHLSLAYKVLNLKIEIFLHVINIRASNMYMILPARRIYSLHYPSTSHIS